MDKNAKRSTDDVVDTGARGMWRNAEKSEKAHIGCTQPHLAYPFVSYLFGCNTLFFCSAHAHGSLNE